MFHAIEWIFNSQSSGSPTSGSAGVTCVAKGSNLNGIQSPLILVIQGRKYITRAPSQTVRSDQQFRRRDYMDQSGGMQYRTPGTSQGQRVVKDLLRIEARAEQMQEGIGWTVLLCGRCVQHRHIAAAGVVDTTEPIPSTDDVTRAEDARTARGRGRGIRRHAHEAPVAFGRGRRMDGPSLVVEAGTEKSPWAVVVGAFYEVVRTGKAPTALRLATNRRYTSTRATTLATSHARGAGDRSG